MALEDTIIELTGAVKHLIAAVEADTKLRGAVLEKAEVIAQKADTKATKATKTEKPVDEAKAAKTEKPVEEAKAEEPSSAETEIKELFASYIGGTEREEERDARRGKLSKLLNHEKVKKADVDNATKTSHIKPEAYAIAIKNIKKLIEDGDITTPPAASDDGDDDLGF